MDESSDAAAALGAVTKNNDDGHSRQPYQVAITAAFLAISIPAVVLRIWVRRWLINALGSDDYMMMLALISYLIYNASLMEIVANGGGTHISDQNALRAASEWVIVNEVFYLTTQIALKLSLGLFFLRVVIRKGHRQFVIATMVFSTVVNIFHIFFVTFRCGDPRTFFEKQIKYQCVNNAVSIGMAYQQASVSTITDLVFALLPVPLLWNASMDTRSKISAGFILSLGAFGVVCSIVRFLYVKNLVYGEDFFFTAVNISVWSTIELGTGIVAGSLAALRPLLKRIVRTTREHMTLAPLVPGKQRSTTTKTLSGTVRPTGARSRAPDDLESMPSIFRPWESVGESGGFTTTCIGGASPGGSSGKDEKKSGSRRTSPTSSRRGGGSAQTTMISAPAVGNTTTVTAGPASAAAAAAAVVAAAAASASSSPSGGSGGTPPSMGGSARNSALEAAIADRAAIWPFADDATEPVPLPPPPAPLLAVAAVRGIAKVVDVHVSVEPAPDAACSSALMTADSPDSPAGAVPLGLLVPQYHRDQRERERAAEREKERGSEPEREGGPRQRRDGVVIDTRLPEWERLPDLVHLRGEAAPEKGSGEDIFGPSRRS